MSSFKDLFSVQAKDYAKYRPKYPTALYEYLTSLSPQKDLCWDVGTGNGQAAVELAKIFKKVMATDPSEKQISEAVQRENITYRVESSLTPSLKDHSVNLITIAQAFHWFDHTRFADIIKKIAAPGCHLAVWTYAKASIDPELDQVIDRLYTGILEDYWEKERKLVEEGYRSIQMPFEEIKTPSFNLETNWTFEETSGYFKTWSAMQTYLKTHDSAPVIKAFNDIEKTWGVTERRIVRWPLSLRVWKI